MILSIAVNKFMAKFSIYYEQNLLTLSPEFVFLVFNP